MSDSTGFTLHRAGGAAILSFARAEALNAIDAASFAALSDTLLELEADPGIRVIVLRGAGGNFSAGADIKEPVPPPDVLRRQDPARMPTAILMRARTPSVAAIRGYCLGGGLEIALAADIRIVAEDAVLGFAEIDWGLTTGWGGGILLRRLCGRAAALDLLLTGRRLDAAQAREIGLASETVSVDRFEDRVDEIIRHLAAASGPAIAGFKRILADDGFERELALEIETFAVVSDTPEARARLATFGRRR